jgi:ankyrin repeat protein
MGAIPIDDAVRNDSRNVSQLLINSGSNKPSTHFDYELINACYTGDIELVNRLLNNQVNPNCRDYDSRTPLQLAVSRYSYAYNRNHVDIISLLLKFGADVNSLDRLFLQSPSSDAEQRVNDEIKEMFQKYDIQEPDEIQHSNKSMLFDHFVLTLGVFQTLMIFLHSLFSKYGTYKIESSTAYPMYQDVHVMIFIGFGFLMTFLRRNGYTSIGFTFFISAIVIQWNPLVHGKEYLIKLFGKAFLQVNFIIFL